ncbi:MICOS complex subunit Mic10 [Acrasis kona]|uniref:MICOS complex subunit Mic10 n=1 Tax=Acrasis kona TaxID=1008807 RepID=A0AAW2YW81_9EUKA
MSTPTTPSELQKEEKLEHCLEGALRKTSYGLAFSVLPALLLTSSRSLRFGILGLGTGIGIGMSYTECRFSFEKNVYLQRRHVAKAIVDPSKPEQS